MAAGAVSIGLRVEGMSALLRAMGSVTPEAAKNLKAAGLADKVARRQL